MYVNNYIIIDWKIVSHCAIYLMSLILVMYIYIIMKQFQIDQKSYIF